jgi:ATP-binding cassette subfamily B protein
MRFPVKNFFSYYKPYLSLLLWILACAFVVSAVTLMFPLLVQHITKDVLKGDLSSALSCCIGLAG